MTRSPVSIYNPHQAGWDEGYAEGLAAGAAKEDVYKPGLGARLHEVLRNQQALSEENSDLAMSLSNKEDELEDRDDQIVALQVALEKADNALWPFKVYHDWAQASGFEGDADVELWANQSQFETDTPELQAGYFRRAAEAYAAIKQVKDSAS